MEYAKAHSKLLYLYSLIVIVITLLLFGFAAEYIKDAYYAHWLLLGISLLICFLPLGRRRLAAEESENPRHSPMFWLVKLLLLETSLLLVYLGIMTVFTHWLPLNNAPDPKIVSKSLTLFFKQYALLPWGLYALYAVGLGYISYIKNKDAYFSELLTPVFKTTPTTLLGNVLNFQSRSATLIALSTTFAFITLLFASIITPVDISLQSGFHAKTMVIIVALILFGFTPPFKKLSKLLLQAKIPLFISTCTTLILFSIIIWLLNALFYHLGEAPVKIPAVITWLEKNNPFTLWIIFSMTWWIGWMPIIASHIARLSRGYRVWQVIVATSSLPFILLIIGWGFPKLLPALCHAPLLLSILALIGFIYLMKQITEKKNLPIMIRSYLPKRDHYKRRDHYFYFRKLFQMALISIYLYIPTNVAVIVLMTFTLTLSLTLQIPLYLFCILKTSLKLDR